MRITNAVIHLVTVCAEITCKGNRLKFWTIHDTCNSHDAYLRQWGSTLSDIFDDFIGAFTNVAWGYTLAGSRPSSGSDDSCMDEVTSLASLTSASSSADMVQTRIDDHSSRTCDFVKAAAVTSIIPMVGAGLAKDVDDAGETRIVLILTQAEPMYSPDEDGQYGSVTKNPITSDPATSVQCDSSYSWLTEEQIFSTVKSRNIYFIVIVLTDAPASADSQLESAASWSEFLTKNQILGRVQQVSTSGGEFVDKLASLVRQMVDSAACEAPTTKPTPVPDTTVPVTTQTESKSSEPTTTLGFELASSSTGAAIAISCGVVGTASLFLLCYCLNHRFPVDKAKFNNIFATPIVEEVAPVASQTIP